MKSWIILILILILISTSFLQCAKTKDITKNCYCLQNQACTMLFSMLNIQVFDASNKPVVLDEYRTIKLATNEKLHEHKGIDSTSFLQLGSYLIIDDSDLSKIAICGEDVQFIGIKDSKEIVNEKFTVKNNCCHVELVKGKTSITIQ
jgi:hypothetical protein